MMTEAGLINFSTQEPRELLFELYRMRQRIILGEKLELPLITLLLWPEGKEVSGFLLDMKSEKNDHHILMQPGGDHGSHDLFYSYLSAVRSVKLHDAVHYEHILTEVSVTTKLNREPQTSRMEVRRILTEEANSVSEKVGTPITFQMTTELPEDALRLFIISNLIVDVSMCLKRIASDEIGAGAIRDAFGEVKFTQIANEFRCEVKDLTLLVSGSFEQSFTTTNGRNTLRKMLMELL